MRAVTRRLMAGEVISQEEIAFRRGVIHGIDFILGRPEHVESALEDAITRAFRDAENEEADA